VICFLLPCEVYFVIHVSIRRLYIAPKFTNEANWVMDGQVLMDPMSHFRHVMRLLYQLHCWVVKQLPTEYQALINQEKFFEACSIKVDDIRRSPGPWKDGPDGAILDAYKDLPPADDDGEPEIDESAVPTAITFRREQLYRWIDLLEKCSAFIPHNHDQDFEDMRRQVAAGKTGVRSSSKSGPPQGKRRSFF